MYAYVDPYYSDGPVRGLEPAAHGCVPPPVPPALSGRGRVRGRLPRGRTRSDRGATSPPGGKNQAGDCGRRGKMIS